MPASAGRSDARIEDFLNDKVQTSADLAGIQSLLDAAKKQQALLEKQLRHAKQEHARIRESIDDRNRKLWEKIQAFRQDQVNIDQCLLDLTQSQASDQAAAQFEQSIQKLQQLEVAEGYLDLLGRVESLLEQARENFNKDAQDALRPYISLTEIAAKLKVAQPAADYAAPHLIDHVDGVCRTLWQQMKDAFIAGFEEQLKKIKWPSKDVTMAGDLEQQWANGVKKLLILQEPELKAHEEKREQTGGAAFSVEPLVLLPLAAMVKSLELRFQYHFDGDRPTNKLDKPEYFLSHVVGLLNTYDEFFARYLQPVLTEQYRSSSLGLASVYIDSTSALVTALLPMLRQKLASVVPQVADNPVLFSHLVHELMQFDTSLRDEWNYDGGNRVLGWAGLTEDVLTQQGWFAAWLAVEKEFALARYAHIVDKQDNFAIDFDSVEASASKPTRAAVQVNDLLETITERYRPLHSFAQKVQFLIEIQISIFDMFHTRLHDSLTAYQSLTSTLGRNLQGASRDAQADMVQGVSGLERLCRVYGSAEFLEKKMRDWSDDVFFVDLWEELQERAAQHHDRAKTAGSGGGTEEHDSASTQSFAGPLSVSHVAERTSRSIDASIVSSSRGATPRAYDADDIGGALFNETASAFRRLRLRCEDVMQSRVTAAVRDAARTYTKINPWSAVGDTTITSGGGVRELGDEGIAVAAAAAAVSEDKTPALSPTAELDPITSYVSDTLTFLARHLGRGPLRQITRQLAQAVQSVLWDSVLAKHHFAAGGAAQFQRDIDTLAATIDGCVGESGAGRRAMARLVEALVLLTLPATTAATTATINTTSEDGGEGTTPRTLWTVEQQLFRNNESARAVLEDLGLHSLSESAARSVLERRIELGR